ncbi:hypothetical protein CMO89_01300 [Candidatus Woesearchaeota archaeon]|nr:hypothetical protein [Candidatus Woesearchaeota archaeon]|tara:strand:+ start:2971 stop:3942 length:972 start_codon:yes stop_codon:yes gene_type:complete
MKTLLFIIMLFLITSCSANITSNAVADIPREKGEIKAFFCPSDNCEGILHSLLKNAKRSIHCALFDLKLESIIDVLDNKSKNMDVKVVIDNVNDKGQVKGSWVRKDDGSQYSHNKFCIIDNGILTTGSFNPTERGAYKNNNNLIVSNSRSLVQNYEDEFLELWEGRFGEGENVRYPVVLIDDIKVENYFCPEDQCSKHIVNALLKAKKSIYFMVFSFTLEEIADAILFADVEDVKGVFEKVQAGSKYSQFKRLEGFGLNVTKDSNPANMHHKVFIIDNETVITGSMNPSGSGDYKNDENVLIIHDKEIAQEFLEEFERVWGFG